MNFKTKFILILMLMSLGSIVAQNSYTLSGTITAKSDNMPIPSANIIIEGTNTGVASDFDGNYQIQVKQGDVLVFSYIGFVTQKVTIDSQTVVNIVLEEDAAELDEVVVVDNNSSDETLRLLEKQEQQSYPNPIKDMELHV